MRFFGDILNRGPLRDGFLGIGGPPSPLRPNLCKCGCLRPCEGEYSSRHDKWKTTRRSPVDYRIEDRGFTTPCWIWQLRIGDPGYGKLKDNGVDYPAHRFYYEKYKGTIPAGLVPDHLCRVRACVNPDHLEAVTGTVNVRRGASSKLEDAQIPEIVSMYQNGATMEVVAAAFCISVGHVSEVIGGKKRAGVCEPIRARPKFKRKLSDEDVRAIRTRAEAGESKMKLSREFSVHRDHIGLVVRGKRWARVA